MHSHQVGRSVRDPRQLQGTVVHLFGGPYVSVESERREVPEGSKQLLAFVALRRATGRTPPRGGNSVAVGR